MKLSLYLSLTMLIEQKQNFMLYFIRFYYKNHIISDKNSLGKKFSTLIISGRRIRWIGILRGGRRIIRWIGTVLGGREIRWIWIVRRGRIIIKWVGTVLGGKGIKWIVLVNIFQTFFKFWLKRFKIGVCCANKCIQAFRIHDSSRRHFIQCCLLIRKINGHWKMSQTNRKPPTTKNKKKVLCNTCTMHPIHIVNATVIQGISHSLYAFYILPVLLHLHKWCLCLFCMTSNIEKLWSMPCAERQRALVTPYNRNCCSVNLMHLQMQSAQ